jgi:hypothetical protein
LEPFKPSRASAASLFFFAHQWIIAHNTWDILSFSCLENFGSNICNDRDWLYIERERYLKTFIILEIFADNFLWFNQKPLKLTCKVVIESYGKSETVPDMPARKKL